MRIGILLLSVLLVSCGSQLTPSQVAEGNSQLEKMNELIASGNFDFTANRATISKLGPVELSGNFNFLRFKNDSVEASLPYFGERYSGVGYGSQTKGGIEFEGIPENLIIERDDKKKKLKINFSISDQQERYDVVMYVFPNQTTTIDVNSSQRSFISYRGSVTELKKKS